ncbi:MAG: cytochrome c [Gemmatimonadota bacterium]
MSKILRWLGIGLGSIILVAAIGFAIAVVITEQRQSRKWPITTVAITVPTDSASIARGAHLASAIGKCVDCHGPDLGGRLFIDGMPMGKFVAPNITPGGPIASWPDADVARAIHHGIAPDGRGLVFMPADAFNGFGAEDLGSIIAYVRQVPKVERALPATKLGPIGRVLWATGKMELQAARVLDLNTPIAVPPPRAPTAAYGKYLTQVGGCTSCHGPDLKGGLQFGPPGTPPSQNLTALTGWTQADFEKALHNGVRPDGTMINPFMPWELAGKMTEEEMTAVWAYLQSLKP